MPLVTASSENNGVVDFVESDVAGKQKKIFEHKITIDMFFNVFYHSYKYFSDDNVHTLIPKFDANIYITFFIVCCLKRNQYKYDYGRQARLNRIAVDNVKLPTDSHGNPDWQFMENYIKSLSYSKSLEFFEICEDTELPNSFDQLLEKAVQPFQQDCEK